MNKQNKLLFSVGAAAIALIAAWGFIYNEGTIIVTSTVPNYTVEIDDKTIQCQAICQVKLPPKGYLVKVSAPNRTELSVNVYLLRGEKETIDYTPVVVPKFEQIEPNDQFLDYKYQVSSTNQNYQTLSVYNRITKEFEVVSTNKQPFTAPLATVDQLGASAFAWDNDSVLDYYLVNIKNKTRSKIAFDQSVFDFEKPLNFKLLSSDLLLIQLENKVILHRFSTNGYLTFPVSDISHVSAISSTQLLVLTGSQLESTDTNQTPDLGEIRQLIDTPTEEASEVLRLPATKMYYYDNENGTFTFLNKLPENISEPFQFQLVMVNDIPTQVLITQNDTYQVIFD